MQADLKKVLGMLLKSAISPLVQGNRGCSTISLVFINILRSLDVKSKIISWNMD